MAEIERGPEVGRGRDDEARFGRSIEIPDFVGRQEDRL